MAAFNIPEEDLIDANIYVVVEVGWEYNDEWYYRPESEGGTPINSFTIQSLAEEYCKIKDCEWFINCFDQTTYPLHRKRNPAEYLTEDWYCEEDIKDLVKDIKGLDWSGTEFVCEEPKRLKYDQIHSLMIELYMCRYEVIAVRLTA